MQFIPLKTKILQPPQDDLLSALEDLTPNIEEGDIVLVTSKVVSIHHGQCLKKSEVTDKKKLVETEADYFISGYEPFNLSPMAIKHNAIFYAAGIDESNADDHYILLPEDPFADAELIWNHLRNITGLNQLGVVITDSHSIPLRTGTIGVAIGWHGFHPTDFHKGKLDLFGRPINWSATNIVDNLAGGAALVCGETNESTPVVLARNVPNIVFTSESTRDELFKSKEADIFYPLMKIFYPN
jgi:coenzyme F420-0:L-glutamate ligase